jgi:fructuronate reductase
MDGAQKLPPRLLGTIRDRLVTGAPFPRLALAVAGWVRYASGVDERGRPIDVRDPLATRFARLGKEAGGNTDALADGFLKVAEVFGTDLPRDTAFAAALRTALRSLYEKGARNAVAAACEAGA